MNKQLERYMKALEHNGYFNGSVLVAQRGNVLLNEGYGNSSYQFGILNCSGTKYRLGSLSKAFTAMAILILKQQGYLKLEDTINKFFPELIHGDQITIFHLLKHESGIFDFTFSHDYWVKEMRLPFNEKKFIESISQNPLQFDPGEKMDYSNAGYLLLTDVIEKVTGQTYAQYMKDHICEPLELSNTGLDNGRTIIEQLATGHCIWEEIIHPEFVDMSIPKGAYGLYSNTWDLYVWGQALLQGKLLDCENQNLMFTPNKGGYGFGWFIDNTKHPIALHSGDINGFTNHFLLDLKEELIVIVLSNLNITPVEIISKNLVNLILGHKEISIKMNNVIPLSISLDHFTGCYNSEDKMVNIEQKEKNLMITIPRQFGALSKYKLFPVALHKGEVHFKSDFVDETFIFRLDDKNFTHSFELIDVNSKHHLFLKNKD